MELQRLFESGFMYKGGSVKYFSVRSKKSFIIRQFDWLSQQLMISTSEIKKITRALERLEVHEKRKNILVSVQKNLEDKPLNEKSNRKI